MIGDQAVTEFRDDWWRQPTREWENDPSEDVVIPGRPNESREIPDGGNPASDADFAEEAEKIRRRLSDGPPPRNPTVMTTGLKNSQRTSTVARITFLSVTDMNGGFISAWNVGSVIRSTYL